MEHASFGHDSDNELFVLRYILKSSPMLGTPRMENQCSWNSGHAHFEEIARLLIFGQIFNIFVYMLFIFGHRWGKGRKKRKKCGLGKSHQVVSR